METQESPTLSHGSRTPPIGSGNVQKVKARLEKTKKIQLTGNSNSTICDIYGCPTIVQLNLGLK